MVVAGRVPVTHLLAGGIRHTGCTTAGARVAGTRPAMTEKAGRDGEGRP